MRKRLSQMLDRLEMHLKLLEAYLIVRDPSAPKSAEAFDGLRLKIDGAYRACRRHLAQLAELDRVSRTVDDLEILKAKIGEFLGAEGVEVMDSWDPKLADLFDTHGDRTASMRIVSPAYVEVHEDRTFDVIKRGVSESQPAGDSQTEPQQDLEEASAQDDAPEEEAAS